MSRLRLVLPPRWEGIPLHDEAVTRRAVDRIVAGTGLDDGDGARVRRELRHTLLAQAREAQTSGADYLAISGPRQPLLSGSLLVTPLHRQLDTDLAWTEELEGEVVSTTIPAGPVTRAVRRRPGHQDAAADDLTGLTTLAVDYWLTSPSGAGVLVSCSTPLIAHEEAMVGLFDAVLATATWTEAAAPRTGRA